MLNGVYQATNKVSCRSDAPPLAPSARCQDVEGRDCEQVAAHFVDPISLAPGILQLLLPARCTLPVVSKLTQNDQ
jgi:hypothetical protein